MNTKEIKKVLFKTSLFIARRAFLICLVIFLLSLIIGAAVFYRYYVVTQRAELGSLEEIYFLDKKAYQDILDTWQDYERISQEADSKKYLSPFLKTTPFPEID